MASQFILTVDVGTSSTKTSLWTEAGQLVAHAASAYDLQRSEPLWAEIDGDIWWQAVCETIRTVLLGNILVRQSAAPPREKPLQGRLSALASTITVDPHHE